MREGFIQKHCPKCGGSIFLARDYYGWYEQCLQCGYTCDLASIVEIPKKPVRAILDRVKEAPESKNKQKGVRLSAFAVARDDKPQVKQIKD